MAEPLDNFDLDARAQLGGGVHRFVRDAMATPFELYLFGQSDADAAAAAEAAFQEIGRLEEQLSFFIRSSDIAQINRLSAGQSLRIGGDTWQCLQIAARVHEDTRGAFDPTVGALLTGRSRWNTDPSLPLLPAPQLPADSEAAVGMDLLVLHPTEPAIAVLADHLRLDLGAIGKGYACDRAADLLTDWGIEVAMVVGGKSSMRPLGCPAGWEGWTLRLRNPADEQQILREIRIRGGAIGASAIAQKSHILSPADGQPARHHLGAWCHAPCAAEADALSTALIVMTSDEITDLCTRRPDLSAFVFTDAAQLLSWGPLASQS